MKPADYFGAPSHLRQERCDSIQAEFRAEQSARASLPREPEPRKSIRRDPPPLAPHLVPTDDQLSLRLAQELEYARRMLDGMGEEISADGAVVMRHATSLQAIDIVGQILGHIAAIVRSSDPAGAVETIGMSDLKGRLQRTKID